MTWWLWILLGVGLLVVEIVTPGGFFALFFGVSAILVGAFAALGLGPAWVQWLAFAAVGVALLAALRSRVSSLLRREPPVDALVGELAIPVEDLAPGATGRAELRGSPWTATNASGVALSRGQRCRVARVEELVIFIQPE